MTDDTKAIAKVLRSAKPYRSVGTNKPPGFSSKLINKYLYTNTETSEPTKGKTSRISLLVFLIL